MKKAITLALLVLSSTAMARDYNLQWDTTAATGHRLYEATNVTVNAAGEITGVTWAPVHTAQSATLPITITLPDTDIWHPVRMCSYTSVAGEACREGAVFLFNPLRDPPSPPINMLTP